MNGVVRICAFVLQGAILRSAACPIRRTIGKEDGRGKRATRLEPLLDEPDISPSARRQGPGAIRNGGNMTIRIRRTLTLFVLGLSVIAIGAAEAARIKKLETTASGAAEVTETEGVQADDIGAAESVEAEPAPAQDTGAAETAESELAPAQDAGAAETAESEPAPAEKSGNGGLFSKIVSWFRGEGPETASEQEPEREAPEKDITPSDVYRATLDMIAEIETLRRAQGVAGDPREMNLREDQAPIYAYAKSLEVMEKTARVQRRLGMIPVEVGTMPVKPIAAEDVYRSVQDIIGELRRIKRQLVVKDLIQPASFSGGKTSSLVYKNLGDASYLLDGLVGRPTTPNDVHMQVLRVQDEMKSIAVRLQAELDSEPPVVKGGKEPKDVAQQVLRATYKVINLQSRLGMDASSVPRLTLVDVTPAEVFDAANILLAEVARIKVHLNVHSPRKKRPESRDARLADVFGQALLIVRNLDVMTRVAGNTE